jgi:uncharacterized membrane protein (UPF0127 family)
MRRFLLLLPLLMLTACADDEPAEPSSGDPAACEETPGITYRTDAQLTFLRADSTEVKQIAVEIVDRDSTIQRGLMDRRCLPSDWGMLFIFPDEAPRTFYMANTPRSLDIMFVAADSTLLNVAEYTEPFSPDILPSEGPARFVVETPAGFTDRYGLAPGDRIAWTTQAQP